MDNTKWYLISTALWKLLTKGSVSTHFDIWNAFQLQNVHLVLQLQCVQVIHVKEPNAMAILMQHVYQVFVVDAVRSFMMEVERKCIVEVFLIPTSVTKTSSIQ